MAGTSLLTLLDDIASLLDDVAALTKVATKKTAGVLGDDLALNAEQVTGVNTNRELPVVWAVAKGSTLNKVILVPAALLVSAIAPWAITPLLMIGGAFLCFEGFEKIAHKLLHPKEEVEAHHTELVKAISDEKVDMVAFENAKIKGAIRTDFILSAEIVVIALGSVATAAFGTQVMVLVALSALMTVGVYGLVAGIVKLDDAGLHLSKKAGALRFLGVGLLLGTPYLMKALSIGGTAAMFLVGGGILAHGLPEVEPLFQSWTERAQKTPGAGPVFGALLPSVFNGGLGLAAGGVLVALFTCVKRMLPKATPA